jgi:hypothetical protein
MTSAAKGAILSATLDRGAEALRHPKSATQDPRSAGQFASPFFWFAWYDKAKWCTHPRFHFKDDAIVFAQVTLVTRLA